MRHEPSSAEHTLWMHIRSDKLNDIHFRRQHPIGKYIVDFCAIKEKLIVELDGSQHLDQEAYDQERTHYLESLGYRVLRFWNNDVENDMDAVITKILFELNR